MGDIASSRRRVWFAIVSESLTLPTADAFLPLHESTLRAGNVAHWTSEGRNATASECPVRVAFPDRQNERRAKQAAKIDSVFEPAARFAASFDADNTLGWFIAGSRPSAWTTRRMVRTPCGGKGSLRSIGERRTCGPFNFCPGMQGLRALADTSASRLTMRLRWRNKRRPEPTAGERSFSGHMRPLAHPKQTAASRRDAAVPGGNCHVTQIVGFSRSFKPLGRSRESGFDKRSH